MKLNLLSVLSFALFLNNASAIDEKLKFNDSHFHLTNYIQEGISTDDFLKIMGDRVDRSTLFGIPLQQIWSHRIDGNKAPAYYLASDAPLYYYSFTDAFIADVFLKLKEEDKKRFDPMITGFNPNDMYAVDHIKRVLKMYPGVFSGLGEFTIHKEFVSSKIDGATASLNDPALSRILDFAGKVGLVVIIHSDIDTPFSKKDSEPTYHKPMIDLLKKHKKTNIIWAHGGLGRVIRPLGKQLGLVKTLLEDKNLKHVSIDISWDEVAKYLNDDPKAPELLAEMMENHPTRFLFGTDTVAPKDSESYYKVFSLYDSVWEKLSPETSKKVRYENYNRLFDEARIKVRKYEQSM